MAEPARAPEHHTPKVPRAVAAAAARAEEIQRAAYTPPAEEGGNSPSNPPEASTPAPDAAGGPPAAAPPPPAQPDAEARWRETQGRLDAERENSRRLQDQLNQTNQMLAGLQNEIRQLREASAPQPAGELPRPKGKLVTQKEIDDYGAELLEVVGKRARDEVADEIDSLKATVNTLTEQLRHVGKAQSQTNEERVLATLAAQIPDWARQNDDPAFLEWLGQRDPFSGIIRHQLLNDAFTRHDAGRVIRFFQGYRDEVAATGASQPAPASAPGNPGQPGKVPLETFAAPGKATPAAPAQPGAAGDKPVYKTAQIAKFFQDKTMGLWKGREADAARIEADIFAAQQEGRVIP